MISTVTVKALFSSNLYDEFEIRLDILDELYLEHARGDRPGSADLVKLLPVHSIYNFEFLPSNVIEYLSRMFRPINTSPAASL